LIDPLQNYTINTCYPVFQFVLWASMDETVLIDAYVTDHRVDSTVFVFVSQDGRGLLAILEV